MAAKTPRKTKTPAVAVPVPANVEECASYIRRLGDIERQHATRKAELDTKVAALVDEYAAVLLDLANRRTQLHQGIQVFCEAHRQQLTQGGKTKTVRLVTGEVAWRNRPPSVTVRNAAEVLDTLRRIGLANFIRKVEEIDKEAILRFDATIEALTPELLEHEANRKAVAAHELLKLVKGLSIAKGVEDFSVAPFETEDASASAAAATAAT
jgi:phage host-nuclease inhibitor protein Gam